MLEAKDTNKKIYGKKGRESYLSNIRTIDQQ